MSGHPDIDKALREQAQGDFTSARATLSRLLENEPRNTHALRRLADVLQRVEGDKEAARCLEHLALIQGEDGQFDEAVSSLAHALTLWPEFTSARHNLGVVKQALGRHDEAEACFRAVLDHAPSVLTWNSLGRLLEGQDRLAEARDCFRAAISLEARDPASHANLAAVMHAAGRLTEAEQGYRTALALDAHYHPALTGLGVLLDLQGKYQEGLDLLREHAAGKDAPAELVLAYGRLLRHAGKLEDAVAALRPQLDRADLSSRHRRWVHFSLGDVLDDLSQYDKAFEHFRAANEMMPATFSPEDCKAFVDRNIALLRGGAVAALPSARPGRVRPIFIVGMPRSGTTLVEQILSCHSRVRPGGERNEILDAAAAEFGYRIGDDAFPASLLSANAERLDEIAQRYLSIPQTRDQTVCITDKFPVNFKFLGLIGMLFPNAAVIDCRRNPMDCGLSCYSRPLSGEEFSFASRLEHIGFYYSQYERLMEHWRKELSVPVLDLQYEVLVADYETTIRRLLAFLDLEWEPACMEFHKHVRIVNTASHAQVRRPLYKDAVGRHANYRRYLEPLASSLRLAN